MVRYPIYVTLDTNILDAAKFDLEEKSTLQLLVNYVKRGKVKVVLSNIVIKEAEKHIVERGDKVCSLMRKMRNDALKEATEYQIEQIGLGHILEIVKNKDEIREKSVNLLRKYIKDLDAEILDTSEINWDAIIDDYFEIRAPFQEGEKKRKEFPDAFIASQIRARFGLDDVVAIISDDNGFKKACQYWDNHLFYSSLGDFYEDLSKQEDFYDETVNFVSSKRSQIEEYIFQYIQQNENIEVIGKSYDRKGVSEGYDYTYTCLDKLADLKVNIHSVDEVDENSSIITLKCEAEFTMDCYYDDYDNSPWDSEEKEYVYVEKVHVKEKHQAIFACRIEINREEKTFDILHSFKIILGGDSRKERYEVDDNSEYDYDYEQEIEDMDREAVGLNPLGNYESYLEEDLAGSEMVEDIVERFFVIDDVHRECEDIAIIYDELVKTFTDAEKAKSIIKVFASKMESIVDFPVICDVSDIDDDELKEVKEWAESKSEHLYALANQKRLPDTIYYGDDITIEGINGNSIIFKLDALDINPSAGEKEEIDINLYSESETIASGTIELTVGFMNFDDDGGVTDGLEDSIEYDYRTIIDELDAFIQKQNEFLNEEKAVAEIIEDAIA